MNERPQKQQTPTKPVVHERGKVTRVLGMISALLAALLFAVGVSVLVECLGIALNWWPGNHAMTLLIKERTYIEAIDQYPLTALTPLALSDSAAQEFDGVWQSVFSTRGINPYVAAGINTVKLVLLRLSICLFVLPGFVLVALVAFYDGLVARDIRKYTGGHESSYVFHKAKRWIVPSLLLTISVYLMLPFSLRPVVIFAPSMLFTGLMIYVATSRFKKFL
jgi:Domain of unknown function (DUF4400)